MPVKSSSPHNRCLLALDAAGAACSVALWREGGVAAHHFTAMRRGQSEHLVPMIEEVMDAAEATYDTLDALAVTVGPGGFTGVRIGLATARGLALALHRPLIGISNFEAVAAAVPTAERTGRLLAVVLDSKRHEVYVQAFAPPGEALGPGAAVPPEALESWLPDGPVLLAGDAAPAALAALQAGRRDVSLATSPGLADAAQVAAIAAARPLPQPDADLPRPLYLRPPDATPPPPARP
jgi:tRNA threonylcarbamoyladenosine biosynthesis protein TsaB